MKKDGKFVKIQDGTIIKRESLKGYHKDKYDPKGVHYYIAVYDKKKKAYSLYPTSHFVDPSKVADIRNNRAILMKIKGANGYSTVYRIPRTKDVNGQLFKDGKDMLPVGTLTEYQMKRFMNFVNENKRPPRKTGR